MPTDYTQQSCYLRRSKEPFEVSVIFAIREKYPHSRLSGVNGNPYRWVILNGPIKDMIPVDSVEEAWASAWCKINNISVIPEGMLEQLRGSKR